MGGNMPDLPTKRRPFDGPAVQLSTPPNAPMISNAPRIGVTHAIWNASKKAAYAWITPAVRLVELAGTTSEIASVGGMKISTIMIPASKMAFGISRSGFFSSRA